MSPALHEAQIHLFERVELEGEITIGRGTGCRVRLPDPRVSREHLVLRPSGDGWELEDKSTNGTTLNGRAAPGRTQLRPKDRVEIQGFVLLVQRGFLLLRRPEDARLSA